MAIFHGGVVYFTVGQSGLNASASSSPATKAATGIH